jgi:hypothetical protein
MQMLLQESSMAQQPQGSGSGLPIPLVIPVSALFLDPQTVL